MSGKRLWVSLVLLVALVGSALPAGALPWSAPQTFANQAFRAQWERTDHPAAHGERSWYWGPTPWFDYYEFYREAPRGLRQVQYFDKGRMELNQPGSGAVTNGLLVIELITGRIKYGDRPDDSGTVLPAHTVPVAGDALPGNQLTPSYALFQPLATLDDPTSNRNEARLGQPVSGAFITAGTIGERLDLAQAYADQTRIAYYDQVLGHNVPAVFWDFLNQRGPIVVDGEVRQGPVVDWLQTMGYPIADAYWVRAKVGGVEQDVLVQLFERRSLTFTPANPAGYQVEMGNVGQHYFQWRYPRLGQPWAYGGPSRLLAYATRTGGPAWTVATLDPEHPAPRRLTDGTADTVPYSREQTWRGETLLADSPRADGTHRQLYRLTDDGHLERLSFTDGSPLNPEGPSSFPQLAGNDLNPAASPDGRKVAFVSDRTGQFQLYLMPLFGYGNFVQLTDEACMHLAPSWSPDGRSLIWMARCDGDWDIYKGELAYGEDRESLAYYRPTDRSMYLKVALEARLTNVVNLTRNQADDQFPRFSPDGTRIAFQSARDGNYELYLMRADGAQLQRVTNNPWEDEAPTWSPDGRKLAFASSRDGDWEIYVVDVSTSVPNESQITYNSAEDRWPVWFR